MKTMLIGFAAIILIALAASFGLNEIGFSSEERFSGNAVRLGDPE